MRKILKNILLLYLLIFIAESCHRNYTPKPRGYFRIDFPEKKYISLESECPYVLDYPEYGIIEKVQSSASDNCWYNISFPQFNAKIHLTYKNVDNNLSRFTEDIHTLTYKHTIKADDIQEIPVINDSNKVYGIIYEISGNTASSLTFFLTDSSKHFLSGALYFSATPNSDSLMPCLQFFRQDVVHLTESLKWK